MSEVRLRKLIKKYLAGDCTPKEKELLERWYAELNMENRRPLSEEQLLSAETMMRSKLFGKPHKSRVRKRIINIAAASFIGFMIIASAVYLFRSYSSKNEDAPIAPGTQKAVLVLGNGQNIFLDSSVNGPIATQANSKIMKSGKGQIAYQVNKASTRSTGTPIYNTLIVPKGGEFRIVLPDGSAVWINSASELRYPASFAGQKNREIYLTGEAYFEIKHDELHPFIVKSGKQEVRVLGTHFNVNAYPDNRVMKTTLLEGSLEVKSLEAKDSCILKPGNQAILDRGIKVQDVDVENVIDWKDGYFIFNKEPLKYILIRLSRWYNVEIIYESNVENVRLDGIISRNTSLSEVLSLLSGTGKVHFKVKERKIYAIN